MKVHFPNRPALLALLGGCILAITGSVGPQVSAQVGAASKLSIFLSHKKDGTRPRSGLELRPNLLQPVYVFVQNDSDKDEEVTVLFVGGEQVEISQTVKALKGEATLVRWTTAAGAPKDKEPGLKELPSPAFFSLIDTAKKRVGDPYPVVVARPRSYLEPEAKFYPATKGRLSRFDVLVKRQAGFTFTGPPSRVELELRPDRITGLVPRREKRGRYAGLVSAETDNLSLSAVDLSFQGPGQGYVFLHVDGYPRAFVFEATFPPTGTPATALLITKPLLRAGVPRYTRPVEKLPLVVEADGPVGYRDRVKLEVLAGTKDGEDVFSEVAEFRGPRQEKLFYRRGPGSSLLFQPEVKDWATTLDLSGVFGRTKIRMRLLNTENEEREVIDGVTGMLVTKVIQDIVVDDSAPDVVRFIDLPRQAHRGSTLLLRARAVDKQSDIAETVFYLGKPGPDGKLPVGTPTARGVPSRTEKDVWLADFGIAIDQKSPLDVTVRAINGVGLSGTDSAAIAVVDPPPDKASVTGIVVEQDVPVDLVPVRLLNARRIPISIVRTAGGGKFGFKGLVPGRYTLTARRLATNTVGETAVTIRAAEQITDLEILLQPPNKDTLQKGKGRIEGTVVEGNRLQAGLTVELRDPAGKTVATAMTDKAGKYELKNLEPGSYTVFASKSASRTRGQQAVGLREGEVKTDIVIKLFR